MPMKNPSHPRNLIRTEILEPVGLNVTQAAAVLKIRRVTLSDMLNGRAALSPDLALRIEKAFGVGMEALLRMQLAYDVAQVRKHQKRIKVSRYRQPKTRSRAAVRSPSRE